MEYFLAIDIGSTNIKAIVYEMKKKKTINEKKLPTPLKLNNRNKKIYENDADEIFRIIQNIIDIFSSEYKEIKGIIFSTQMHGCVLKHQALKKDLYISWQDTRNLGIIKGKNKSYLDELKEKITKEDMKNTGVYLKPALALCNLYTLFRDNKLKKEKSTQLFTLGSYIISRLTGNNICHITNAAPMGFVNIKKCAWDHNILKKAGLDFLQLPSITTNLECCGDYKGNSGIIKIYPDAGDVQTATCGSGAQIGDLVINVATAGQMIFLTDKYTPGNYEIRPYFNNNYINVISSMPAGRNFEVIINFIKNIGKEIFDRDLSKDIIFDKLQNLDNIFSTEKLDIDPTFYEQPDKLPGGKISNITKDNLTLNNLVVSTLVSFAKVYSKYIQRLINIKKFNKKIILAGGAILKNKKLQEEVKKEFNDKNIVLAPKDEVYTGMLNLALDCLKRRKIPNEK